MEGQKLDVFSPQIRNLRAKHLVILPDVFSPPPLRAIHRTPYVTGTTVLGMKYKDGVMIACDTLGTCYERAPDLDEFRSQAVCQLRFFWRNATLNRSACFFLSSSSSSRVE